MLVRSLRIASVFALFVAIPLLFTACADESSSESADDTSETSAEAGRLAHVDGTIMLAGETITVMPNGGGGDVSLALGPAVERGPLAALATSKARVRVFYEAGDDPVAARVEEAPDATADLPTYTGQVAAVSADSITIDGDDGERTFDIRPADAAGFDVTHLEEHRTASEPVLVYYRTEGTEYAVAYEDA